MVSGETLNCFDMEKIDCGIFCEWEYDDDFISVLSDNLKSRHISHQVFRPADFDAFLGSCGERRCRLIRSLIVRPMSMILVRRSSNYSFAGESK